MNILLWYLPYAMFSGACDVVLSESETRTDAESPAKPAERASPSDEPASARAAQATGRSRDDLNGTFRAGCACCSGPQAARWSPTPSWIRQAVPDIRASW